jgi:DNA-binding transcriptional LysR family regulator
MDHLSALKLFLRVAELGSFTRAAESVGVQKGAASQAVRQLEDTLGARLLHRTTRHVELTQEGRACYERTRDLLDDHEELRAMFRRGRRGLTGRLRVDMPTGMAKNVVLPQLPQFTRRHPGLQLEVSATDRRVDLVREGFDCVIRVGTLEDLDLVAVPLGAMRVVNCAAPTYLAEYGTPRKLADLSKHRLVHYASNFGAKPYGYEYPDGAGYRTLQMQGSVTVNNADAYQAACLAGYGLIQVPDMGVRDLIAKGLLVEVLPDLPSEPMPVSLLYAHHRHLPQRVRAFTEWISGVLKPWLAS